MADLPRIEKNDILISLTYSMDFPFVIIYALYLRSIGVLLIIRNPVFGDTGFLFFMLAQNLCSVNHFRIFVWIFILC